MAKPNDPLVFVAGYHSTVTCFSLDLATGALRPSTTSDGGPNPSFLAWSPNRRYMYACNEIEGGGHVSAFTVDTNNGTLTKINEAGCAGHGPCHVGVSASGKWVFVANYGSGHVGVLAVRADGGVGEPLECILVGVHAHQMYADASGKFVFVPCLGSDYVRQYIFDDATGALTPNTPPHVAIAEKHGPRHMAIHPSGRWAYVINELGLTITRFDHDATKGTLSNPESVSTVPEGTDPAGKYTAHVLVSPDGRFLYGSNRGQDDIVYYAIDSATGRLSLAGRENGGGDVKFPRHFAMDPEGKYVIVANQKGNSVTVFRRDAASGGMRKLQTVSVPSGPSFVGVLPR